MYYVWDMPRELLVIGPFAIRWYSVLFALGFVIGYQIAHSIFTHEGKSVEVLDSLLIHLVVGTIVGARLGHCLLYEPETYLADPISILKIWEGGLASHGGFFGVMISLVLFSRRHQDISFFWIADRMSITCMLAAGLIRLGNLFNSEIVGLPTTLPWAIVFKKIDMLPRHPTPIYEALGYGAISLIMYLVYRANNRKPKEGRMFGLVMILGFGFRFIIEGVKENQVPFEDLLPINMGQILSIPFVIVGILFLLGIHEKIPFLRRGLSADINAGDAPRKQGSHGQKGTSRPAKPRH